MSNIAEFEAMLSRNQFDIITVSATWLNDIKLVNSLLSPIIILNNRTEKRGAGVGIYIKDSMKYSVR